MLTLNDRITDRVRRRDYHQWRDAVTAIGGCARPIHLTGTWQLTDRAGTVLAHRGGNVMVPCGNRRASVCPTCSDRYAADAFHLVRAGLSGGKGVPEAVIKNPRWFVTLTAPSFGPVHSVTRRCCRRRHRPDDPVIGTPLDPDRYDYVGAILWQAHAGKLWHRFTIALRRHLANAAGLRVRDFHARISYAKVAEYQRRGLVHFHAVIRLDGATAEFIDQAIHAAARAVRLRTRRPDGTPFALVWGTQLDVRPIGDTDVTLASYIAKYATKGTGARDTPDRPIRSQRDVDHLDVGDHHRRMIQTAWNLGALHRYMDLNLRKWAHMLGFRGHFLTKSKYYSTTFTRIRDDRRAYRLAEAVHSLGLEPDQVVVINHWTYTGSGHRNDAERELALAMARSRSRR
ncbi:replication initiator protein RepSA [Saccharothrix violaceirubra]|uniref:Replication initiation protein n=1 Tax=Saccharothrix violaceirubra TaxID=413306 RepID=A0A7W7WZ65_9PSEU|nr:replication initiator [Saccharothrix violaceirubra]MBB4968972.1 hypothetical protein [Saccharothrix violaceirubra]